MSACGEPGHVGVRGRVGYKFQTTKHEVIRSLSWLLGRRPPVKIMEGETVAKDGTVEDKKTQ